MKKLLLILSVAALHGSPAHAQAGASFQTQNQRTPESALRLSCRDLAGTSAASGFYWVALANENYAIMYCNNDVTYDGLRGGWTLVWSNLRGGRGKLTSDMHWGASIESLPRYRGAAILGSTPDLQSFEVYTGLRWWRSIMDAGNRREILYEWAHDFGDLRQLDHQAACDFNLNAPSAWTITFNTATCQALVGNDLPGLFTYSAGRRWSTLDNDNDSHASNCAVNYSGSPWWYGTCWSGSINGSGETHTTGQRNGAYWSGSDNWWGRADGTGAGNGWIYIR